MLLVVSIIFSLVIYGVLNKVTKKFIWDEMTPVGHQKKTFIRYVMVKVYLRDILIISIVSVPLLIYFEIF